MLRVLTSNVFASFCKLKLDKNAVAAIWAEAVYNRICKVADLKSIDKMLIEDIQDLKLADSAYKNLQGLAEETDIADGKKEVMEIFDPVKGAHLPPSLRGTQERFTQELHEGRISFYPNLLTTPTIF